MTAKLDLRKADKAYYGGKPNLWQRVTLPPARYLALEGAGAPEGPAYAEALAALYPLAYAVKFAAKGEGRDFTIPPQSTLWWADDPAAFAAGRRDDWRWQAMIRVPDWVDAGFLDAARAGAKPGPRRDEVRLALLDEGDCFQMLHVGPYSAEAPRLAELHERLMPEAGVTFAGHHHEIYLSDPRRVAPEKLKTILRQPVRPA